MGTTYHTFTGEAIWSKVYKGQVDNKFPTNDGAGKFSIGLKPDVLSQEEFEESGIRIKPKDGFYFFSRPEFKVFNGEKTIFGPPEVVDEKGNVFTESIGNGSIVQIEVVAYDSKFGKGHRLDSVRVLDHVPYVKPTEGKDASPPAETEAPAKPVARGKRTSAGKVPF
jgi:hypothetical protein